MSLAKRYQAGEAEPRLQAQWQASGVYHYAPDGAGPVFSIDTPPPTVSGHLHLGHVYSYSHADFIARFQRMRGRNVFYPMGYDDNGLPTERLVEKRLGATAAQVGRSTFIQKCLKASEEAEKDYQALWQRLGLSVDWRYTYRTIDALSRRTSQHSFIELYKKDRVYRSEAAAIWCPECHTAIAQAELNDMERPSEFVTLPFTIEGSGTLPIATTRPELLPACVAVFVHPGDRRFRGLAGRQVRVPVFGQVVPVLEDPGAGPEKGTGAVMCCTFGDTADLAWQRAHHLPVIEAIDRDGRMTAVAGDFAGLPAPTARQEIQRMLDANGLVLARETIRQSVRVHERCDTPVEYIVTKQWFVRVLDQREALLKAGEKVTWHPESMQARYRAWVENLNWDWCISRQRYFGVPFPVWYCEACGQVMLADENELPVDPGEQQPGRACGCGSESFTPEADVMDTWATSSLSPQIVGRWLPGKEDPNDRLFAQVFPFSLRPQAHEIIRTWAFYTIVKSMYHNNEPPWNEALISGWGLAGEGMGKISKSRGGGPMPPMEMITTYSADAVRYWAASSGTGKDAMISEEKIQLGAKLATKLWNVARFSERFLDGYLPQDPAHLDTLTPADRWILSRTQRLIRQATVLFVSYDYAAAKSETESFFWTELADNYLEMCKQRLYDETDPMREGARATLYHVLLALLKLLAPLLPHVTEEIYLELFAGTQAAASLHRSAWPEPEDALQDATMEAIGDTLVEVATSVRRYKSEHNLSLGTELARLQLAVADPGMAEALREASADLMSITRASRVEVSERLDPSLHAIQTGGSVTAAILPGENLPRPEKRP